MSHAMAEKDGLAGDQVGTAWVRFVGGWKCVYYIDDQFFECLNEADPGQRFSFGGVGVPPAPYSGYYKRVTSPTWADETCFNKSCAQCFPDHGPIPVGNYTIGEGYLDPVRPLMTYRLTVLNELCDPPGATKHVRDGLLIHHGDAPPASWSTGCIVIPDQVSRDLLNKYGGGLLEVKASKDGFDPKKGCMDPELGRLTNPATQPARAKCSGLEKKP